jgi:hypothetical protein
VYQVEESLPYGAPAGRPDDWPVVCAGLEACVSLVAALPFGDVLTSAGTVAVGSCPWEFAGWVGAAELEPVEAASGVVVTGGVPPEPFGVTTTCPGSAAPAGAAAAAGWPCVVEGFIAACTDETGFGEADDFAAGLLPGSGEADDFAAGPLPFAEPVAGADGLAGWPELVASRSAT